MDTSSPAIPKRLQELKDDGILAGFEAVISGACLKTTLVFTLGRMGAERPIEISWRSCARATASPSPRSAPRT